MTNAEFADRLREASVPALQLTAAHGGRPLSKLGGLPDVDPTFKWPVWNGKPLAFLAQIDLAAIPESGPLPSLPPSGVLYFFYDQEQSTWGFDPKDRGSWRVLYSPSADELAQAAPPNGLSENYIYNEMRVELCPIQSVPGLERLGVDLSAVPNETFDMAEELRAQALQGGPEHQIGGFPDCVQGDGMELECQLASNGLYCGNASYHEDPRAADLEKGAADWTLLLQLDTDDDTGMMWGDCGRLYFWVRTEDLNRQDFSNFWMVLQCY